MPIRTLIVDDESLARQTLRLLLENDPAFEFAGECPGGAEAIEFVRTRRPDLVFLDIQMPGLDGFEVIERVGVDRMPPVVFVTAYDEYAVRAFEVQALDYLLKPFDDDRFFQTLTRAREEIANHDTKILSDRLAGLLEEKAGRAPRPLSRIALRSSGGKIVFVDASEIDRIEAEDYYVRLHVGNVFHLWRVSMNALERRLDRGKFLRIHRSAIVNLEFVSEIQPGFKGESFVQLRDGTRLPLARSRRGRLRDLLAGKE
jgi:two-component system LytT family response regulator